MRIPTIVLALCATGAALAQDLRTLPVNQLIDNPTAGILARGDFDFQMTLYSAGGVLVSFDVGLLERLNMGASFGGTNIVSDEDPDWNGRPELSLKYRIVDETVVWPALVVGYTGQGHGQWLEDVPIAGSTNTIDRYEVKAKGFYGVAGKNFTIGGFGLMGLHGGANVNPVENDDDQGLNLWLGVDKQINDELMVVAEYDLGLDDLKTGVSKNNGFLNLGLRWTFAERLSLEVDFKDIFRNRQDLTKISGDAIDRPVDSISREIRITYIESF